MSTFSSLLDLIFEWFAVVAMADGAEDFPGTQSYVWDAQSDMLFALRFSVSP